MLAVDLGSDKRCREVVARVVDAVLPEGHHELREFLSGREDRGGGDHRVVLGRHVLRVGEPEDDVRPVEDESLLRARDAHQIDDDAQGKKSGDLGDEVALALSGDALDDLGRDAFDVVLERRQFLGREAGRHDAAQPRVAWIVHVDHRAEELEKVGGKIRDVGPPTRAEVVRTMAHLGDVGVARQGPVPGPGREESAQVRLSEECARPLGSEQRERLFSLGDRPGPPIEVRQIQFVEGRHADSFRQRNLAATSVQKRWRVSCVRSNRPIVQSGTISSSTPTSA